MTRHPNKLLVIFPNYEVRDYRRHLASIDDAIVVHHRADGDFLFTLRPLCKLGVRTCARFVLDFANDLERGHIVIVVERDDFLRDLEALVRSRMPAKGGDAIERALLVIAERTKAQIRDACEGDDMEHQVGRMVIAKRPRQTRAQRSAFNSARGVRGIPAPRSEQIWRSLCHEWCDIRTVHHAMATWQQWARRNRPDMPVGDAG